MAKLLQGLFLSIKKNVRKDSPTSFLIFNKILYAMTMQTQYQIITIIC